MDPAYKFVYFQFSMLLYFYSAMSQKQIFNVLLHYNYYKMLVTSYFVGFDYYYRTYINPAVLAI